MTRVPRAACSLPSFCPCWLFCSPAPRDLSEQPFRGTQDHGSIPAWKRPFRQVRRAGAEMEI